MSDITRMSDTPRMSDVHFLNKHPNHDTVNYTMRVFCVSYVTLIDIHIQFTITTSQYAQFWTVINVIRLEYL